MVSAVLKTRKIDSLEQDTLEHLQPHEAVRRIFTLTRYRATAENAFIKALIRLHTLKDNGSRFGFVRAKTFIELSNVEQQPLTARGLVTLS